ncbi:sensor histidine kinase [Lacisediminihabitans profunda]|uniref:histidine kinase n=1 Tax=Lacisediminihabitans profunda TaxID=2594790 RepID=A0A5C8UVD9_9MICO|nr:HAMP domain-containing sensor histidine kinase [Lacisediminihabitans profunda]TXN31982.1 HAMP domain-containing histidine kinase [Lacisediminihabitans profunda]
MRLLRRLSIRWRITIGSLVIALLLSAVAVVAFRAQVEHILSTTTTTLLHHDAAPYVTEIQTASGTIDDPGTGQLVAVVNPAGRVVVSSLPDRLESRLPTLTALTGDAHTVVASDDTYRVFTKTVTTATGDWHVVSARNQDSAILSLDRITEALVTVALLLVSGFGVASWLLTGAALRPVNRMRQQAEALVAQGSTEPLPIGPATDELSALATTLNEFISEVRQSVDRERQLVSDASHELRTPLAILMTQLELAHLSTGDAQALEAEITSAQHSVARLSALATGLLELSQIEAKTPEGVSTWDELAVEVAAAADRARLLAAPKGVTVDFDVAGEPTEAVYRIAVANFGRIVGNLTSNAISAVPNGGSVRIALRHAKSNLILTVVDSGPGMPDDFLPVAFDRFSRPDDARAKRDGGSGLGLAIVHAIVSRAHGEITLANGAGFTVTVSLPTIA